MDEIHVHKTKKSICAHFAESPCTYSRRSDRMMTLYLIFGKEMMQVICVYAPQSGKPDIQKDKLYDKLVHE